MKRTINSIILIGLAAVCAPAVAQDDQASSLDELLRRVEQGQIAESRENRQREAEFRQRQQEQQRLLDEARAERRQLEQRSDQLETTFENNEIRIADLTETLTKRLGSLKELFGVLQQAAGDANGLFKASIVSSQFPGRGEPMTALAKKAGTSSTLPSIPEIEGLWSSLMREMTESGKVVRYRPDVVLTDGTEKPMDVIRVGSFNAVTDGRYLRWEPDTQQLEELQRQPVGRHLRTTSDLADAETGYVPFSLDPSMGQILSLLVQSPSIGERIAQGAEVGYIIIALGLFALLLAFERLFVLTRISRRVNAQIGDPTPDTGNPLGRVMAAYAQHKNDDMETIELKLGEAILKESPGLLKFLTLLKIIAVVAPLLGLLGTVTGMIQTFQAITLFGTGDPKIMAGGISQALITTVLGLTVAIPTVLLHTIVSGRSRSVLQILEQEAVGIIAEHSERAGGRASAG